MDAVAVSPHASRHRTEATVMADVVRHQGVFARLAISTREIRGWASAVGQAARIRLWSSIERRYDTM
jgi:hypothetical protein